MPKGMKFSARAFHRIYFDVWVAVYNFPEEKKNEIKWKSMILCRECSRKITIFIKSTNYSCYFKVYYNESFLFFLSLHPYSTSHFVRCLSLQYDFEFTPNERHIYNEPIACRGILYKYAPSIYAKEILP